MPYRRLPNTDTKRLRAMSIALEKADDLPVFKLPFSIKTGQLLKNQYLNFEQKIQLQREALKQQVNKQKEFLYLYKKAKMYVSHFIQVMNMAVIRGELNATIYKFYGLGTSIKVPVFKNEEELVFIGQKLIEGEKDRINQGGKMITNPTIAVVKVYFEKFIEARRFQKKLQENYQRATNQVAEMRSDVDKLIQKLWNEIENNFSDLSENEKRERSREFGVEYVFRKNEKNKLINENIDSDNNDIQYTLSF